MLVKLGAPQSTLAGLSNDSVRAQSKASHGKLTSFAICLRRVYEIGCREGQIAYNQDAIELTGVAEEVAIPRLFRKLLGMNQLGCRWLKERLFRCWSTLETIMLPFCMHT